MFRLLVAIFLGKVILLLTRAFKVGGGSAAPGHYVLKIAPDLVSKLALQIPQNIIITGTNGKTTTARLLSHLVSSQKLKTIRNSTGSNLERGIASALIAKSDWMGKIRDVDLGIWETDEAAFNKVVFQIKPQIIVFLNAFRDQLDRYGEVDSVVSKWEESLEKMNWKSVVLINGSDESLLGLMGSIGIDGGRMISSQLFKVKGDFKFGEKKLKAEHYLIKGDFEAEIKKNRGLEGSDLLVKYPSGNLEVNLPVPGVYHVYDFLAAFGVYYQLNLPVSKVGENLKNYSPAFGRVEKIKIGLIEAYIFLIKNPAGASLVFETVKPELIGKDRLLIALNDNFADGKDVSWIWDAKFEELRVNSEELRVIVSGSRAFDLAVRLKYAGFSAKQIEVEEDLGKALKKSLDSLEGRLFIMPTYTAMLELQKILASKGHKKHYWKEEG